MTPLRALAIVGGLVLAWAFAMRRLRLQLVGMAHPMAMGVSRGASTGDGDVVTGGALEELRIDGRHPQLPISGPDRAVDHDRMPGVPPASTTDYQDMVDIEGAGSFPASDPSSGW